jgi:hypothetical protein
MQSTTSVSHQKTNISPIRDAIHQRAVLASERFRISEAELMSALEEVEKHKVHLHFGQPSLFQYAVRELKLSENVAYTLITVMRKTKEVPELKEQVRIGAITLGHAKRISSVLTSENANEWFEKASTLTQRQLEKEVVKVRPLSAVHERASYVTENRIKLEVGLSESQMLQLRKVQDLVCQSTAKHASIEDTLVAMTEFYLKHRDPVAKAKRVTVKKGSKLIAQEAALVTNENVPEVLDAAGGAYENTSTENGVSDKYADASTSTSTSTSNSANTTASATSLETSSSLQPDVKTVGLRLNFKHGFEHETHQREPIPAAILHAVNLRDQRKCTYINRIGRACGQSRWVEVHHRKPVSMGGKNTLDNLITLCSGHHRLLHAPVHLYPNKKTRPAF